MHCTQQVENVAGCDSLAAEHMPANNGMYLLNERADDMVNEMLHGGDSVEVSVYFIACLYYQCIVYKIIM